MEKVRKTKTVAKKENPLIHIGHWPERPLRKYARALFMVSAGYKKEKDTILFSDDISIGGVFLEAQNPLPPGTKVKLRFPLKSGWGPIRVDGRVIWSRKEFAWGRTGNKNPGMGIAFKNVNKKDLAILKEFLDHTQTDGWFL